jgi:copper homeostasis protein
MDKTFQLEVCVDSVESALAAQEGGATRVELCANLFEGGTTPGPGMMRRVRKMLDIPVHVIIRPRGGDFCYSTHEIDVMKEDIAYALSTGMDGVALGMLTPDGRIDRHGVASLIKLARPARITFHRAFDVSRDPFEALDALIDLGVERLLTSGQETTALEGAETIARLVAHAAGRIAIMAGGGVTERNIRKIVEETGVKEVHASGTAPVESLMRYRNPRVYMGRELRPPEFSHRQTDVARIRAMRSLIEVE